MADPQKALEAIAGRIAAATKGPWRMDAFGPYPYSVGVYGQDDPSLVARLNRDYDQRGRWPPAHDVRTRAEADAEFIAHAREDLPALLQVVEAVLPQLANSGFDVKGYSLRDGDWLCGRCGFWQSNGRHRSDCWKLPALAALASLIKETPHA